MSSNNYEEDEKFNTEQIVQDVKEPLTVLQKYEKILSDRKRNTAKYHKTDAGKKSLKESANRYYLKHKVKILAKKKAKYLKSKKPKI